MSAWNLRKIVDVVQDLGRLTGILQETGWAEGNKCTGIRKHKKSGGIQHIKSCQPVESDVGGRANTGKRVVTTGTVTKTVSVSL